MKFLAVTAFALTLVDLHVSALPAPSATTSAIQGLGTQFVTGKCAQDSDCQQGCCAFATGLCAGPDIAQTNADKGCGFGEAAPNCDVAHALGLPDCVSGAQRGSLSDAQIQTAAKFVEQLDGFTQAIVLPSSGAAAAASSQSMMASASASSTASASQGLGTQFVTGKCAQDSDCQQGCCAFATGLCAGPDVAQSNGDKGCGFGEAAPNCDVALALGFNNCVSGAQRGSLTDAQIQIAAEFVEKLDGFTQAIVLPSSTAMDDDAPASSNAAAAPTSASSASQPLGTQFVTGTCTSDADCQQGCCAFTTGLCAGPGIAQTNADGGCGFGQPAPNCQVAHALGLDACVSGGSPNGVLTQSQLVQAVEFVSKLDNIQIPASFSSEIAAATATKRSISPRLVARNRALW